MKFRPDVIWFLREKGLFTNRRLEIGNCPNCQRQVVRFVETRVTDGKVFDDTFKKRKADKCIKENEKDILYTSLDSVQSGKKTLFGFRYGENTEKVDKRTGEITIIQKACDWYGNKEIVKRHTGY
jgi:hypothetical protein